MKLSELPIGQIETGNNKYVVTLSNFPFWSMNIVPKKNPFSLFSFVCHDVNNHQTYHVFMYKTSYYTNPVIGKQFNGDITIEEIVNWVDHILTTIKEQL